TYQGLPPHRPRLTPGVLSSGAWGSPFSRNSWACSRGGFSGLRFECAIYLPGDNFQKLLPTEGAFAVNVLDLAVETLEILRRQILGADSDDGNITPILFLPEDGDKFKAVHF